MHTQSSTHLRHTFLSHKHFSVQIMNVLMSGRTLLLLPPGPQAAFKVPSQVFPHAGPFSRDTSGPPSVRLCEDGTGEFAWGSVLVWIQSSDAVLLHAR